MKKEVTKAWCIINKKTGKISITEYGTSGNPALDIYPMTTKGEKNALGSFNGYEEVAECEIKVTKKSHYCNCEYCNRKHWTENEKNKM